MQNSDATLDDTSKQEQPSVCYDTYENTNAISAPMLPSPPGSTLGQVSGARQLIRDSFWYPEARFFSLDRLEDDVWTYIVKDFDQLSLDSLRSGGFTCLNRCLEKYAGITLYIWKQ